MFDCAVRVPLLAQSLASGGDAGAEAVTCLRWWTPAAVVIERAVEAAACARGSTVRGGPTSTVPGSPAALAASCAGCYLLVGHASGRLSVFSTEARHVA